MSREDDAQIEVELFLRTRGRLPNQPGDEVTKALAKEFIDKCFDGTIKMKHHNLLDFAFHVYASTNKDYK